MRSSLLLMLGLALGGCGEPSVDEAPDDGGTSAPVLQLGTGRREFLPIAADAPLRLQRGCQGSQHVYVSLRAQGLSGSLATVELWLERVADDVLLSLPWRARIPFERTSTDPHTSEVTGLLLVVPEPSEAVSKQVRLRAVLESESGASDEAQSETTLQWGADACP